MTRHVPAAMPRCQADQGCDDMANHHHARLPGRVDWPTLGTIIARDMGLDTMISVVDAEAGYLAMGDGSHGLTSALFFTWPRARPDVTELAIREGGIALDVLRAIAAVTGGGVAASDERMDWVEVPVSRPPVELPREGKVAADLQRLLPLTLAVPLGLACADTAILDGLRGILCPVPTST